MTINIGLLSLYLWKGCLDLFMVYFISLKFYICIYFKYDWNRLWFASFILHIIIQRKRKIETFFLYYTDWPSQNKRNRVISLELEWALIPLINNRTKIQLVQFPINHTKTCVLFRFLSWLMMIVAVNLADTMVV